MSENRPVSDRRRDGRVADRVDAAKRAATELANADQPTVDDLVGAVGRAVTAPTAAARFGRIAVDETGRGHPDAKMEKIQETVLGVLGNLRDRRSVGVVDRDQERGVATVAHPVGVVGATTPAVHPVVAPAVLTLFALKGRNAVVFAPSPEAVETCDVVVTEVRKELAAAGAPPDLVTMLPPPPSKPRTDALFERVDLVCAAGASDTVAAGQRCGTPNYCAGGDGLVAVVDETVDPRETATRIGVGATYDFGSHPAGDAAVVVTAAARDDLVAGLEAEGGYVASERERDRLRELLNCDDPSVTAEIQGRSPRRVAAAADFTADGRRASFVVVEPDGPDGPLAALPGVPGVAVHVRETFDDAVAFAADLGGSHAAAVHTDEDQRAERAARRLGVGRVVVNQPGTAALTGENGLPATVLLGGGTADGSQLHGGLTYETFIETTAVATPVRPTAEGSAGRVLGQTDGR